MAKKKTKTKKVVKKVTKTKAKKNVAEPKTFGISVYPVQAPSFNPYDSNSRYDDLDEDYYGYDDDDGYDY